MKVKLRGFRGEGEWFNIHHEDARSFLLSLQGKV